MKYFCFFIVLCRILSISELKAQDTIFLLNGKRVLTQQYELNPDSSIITYQNKKNKKRKLASNNVFSIQSFTGAELILYKKDSIDKMLDVNQMRNYIAGEYDARNTYFPKYAAAGGFTIGAFSPLIGRAGIFIPLLTSPAFSYIPEPQKFIDANITTENKMYILGYKEIMKRKRFLNALKGSAAGFIFTTAIILITK